MAYYRRGDSIFDSFSLSPLPYPVLLILAVTSIFLGISWYVNYESVLETAEEQLSWVLFVTPVVLILLARWLSSMDISDMLFGSSPWERRRRTHHLPSEGSSPWTVAAFIVLLLILVQYQSVVRESWLVQTIWSEMKIDKKAAGKESKPAWQCPKVSPQPRIDEQSHAPNAAAKKQTFHWMKMRS
ncbi:hypothetical protein REPUB_Repub01dG0224900 [Reevesia pubescens]